MCVSNKFGVRSFRLLASSILALSWTATTAGALTITDTFLTSGSNAFTGTAVTKAQVQAATNQIAALFSNPITVNIVFGANSSQGNGAASFSSFYGNPYATYVGLLTANSLANPANTVLATSVANLPSGNDANGRLPVLETSPELSANGQPRTGYFDSSGNFVGVGGTQDGVVILGTSALISALFHEVDEVLGGGGAGSMLTNQGGNFLNLQCPLPGCFGGTDLYRYSGLGTPSATAYAAGAYLSFNGGATPAAYFNTSGSGDAGDFVKSPCLIQSWQVCGTADNFVVGSVEYQMLESLGYDPVATPVPAALPLFATGLGVMGLLGRRRKRKNAAALAAA
jgi:hypothetical protein